MAKTYFPSNVTLSEEASTPAPSCPRSRPSPRRREKPLRAIPEPLLLGLRLATMKYLAQIYYHDWLTNICEPFLRLTRFLTPLFYFQDSRDSFTGNSGDSYPGYPGPGGPPGHGPPGHGPGHPGPHSGYNNYPPQGPGGPPSGPGAPPHHPGD